MSTGRYRKTIIDNLKTIRKGKGLTTTDVAKILGVSQAKISYIENDKGVLSAEDVAVLARRLGVPVTEFFRGLEEAGERSAVQDITAQLIHYGAPLLSKPANVPLRTLPFDEVFARALSLIDDDRLHKAFCAALIAQAANQELHPDRIFATIGNNPFLTRKAAEQAELSVRIIEQLQKRNLPIRPRAKQQIQRITDTARKFQSTTVLDKGPTVSESELTEFADFAEDCLNANKR